MAATSLLARIGLRLGTLGSAASLAIAAPLTEGDVSNEAHTSIASRIGVFFDRTTGFERFGVVVMGTTRFLIGDVSTATTQLRVTYDAARIADAVTIGPMTSAWAVGANSVAVGLDAVASEDSGVAVGAGAVASTANSVSIGPRTAAGTTVTTTSSGIVVGSDSSSGRGIVIGRNIATGNNFRVIYIGSRVPAFNLTTNDNTVVGDGITAATIGQDSVAIGSRITAVPLGATVVGVAATGGNSQCVAMGLESNALGSVAIGYRAGRPGGVADTGSGVLIGSNTSAGSAEAVVAVGRSAVANGTQSTAIGDEAQSNADCAVSLGCSAEASGAGTIAIGSVKIAAGKTAGIGQTDPGTGDYVSSRYINDFFVGGGSTSTTCEELTFRGSNASGTDVAGGDLRIQPGRGTGSAVGGRFYISTSPAGVAGSASNPAVDRVCVYADGGVQIGSTFTGSPGVGNLALNDVLAADSTRLDVRGRAQFISFSNNTNIAYFGHSGYNGVRLGGVSEGVVFESASSVDATAAATLFVAYCGTADATALELGKGLDGTARLTRTVGGWANQAITAVGRDIDFSASYQTLFRIANRNATASLTLTAGARYFEIVDRDTTTSTTTDIFYVDAARNVFVGGKLTVVGLIDPTGLQLTPVAANPGTAPTLWANSADSNKLYYGASPVVSGGGTVTTVSVVSAHGFAGTVANASSTPAITLTTSVTGMLKGDGTAISAAAAGTDYLAPFGSQAANTVYAAPDGAPGVPSFRVLAEADIPTLAQSKITDLTTDLDARVLKAGDTMTGSLVMASTGATSSGVVFQHESADKYIVEYDAGVDRLAITDASSLSAIATFGTSGFSLYGLSINENLTADGLDADMSDVLGPVRVAVSGTVFCGTDELTDAATINYLATASDNFTLLLTSAVGGTRQLAAPTRLSSGMRWTIRVKQPASGGPCALTYASTYKFPFGLAPVLSTAANAVDVISCYYDGTDILTQVVNSFGMSTEVAVTGDTLAITGATNFDNTLVNTNTTLDATHHTVAVDASGGPITITLPDTTGSGVPGRLYNVKKVDASANAVTIQRSGADTIDGGTSITLTTQYQARTVHARSSSAVWDVI